MTANVLEDRTNSKQETNTDGCVCTSDRERERESERTHIVCSVRSSESKIITDNDDERERSGRAVGDCVLCDQAQYECAIRFDHFSVPSPFSLAHRDFHCVLICCADRMTCH